ncbi:hypothetical protein [Thiomicrorhabdus aquaedulcis]|uniref:hypothetical protein n=1 Tax=Thiomicrorhabdus aquaedulcis TaxID=2211106 RepID=UPI000FDA8E0B|nr:hypothetical protein [Thiomicrorhabdus aquaedulcis]
MKKTIISSGIAVLLSGLITSNVLAQPNMQTQMPTAEPGQEPKLLNRGGPLSEIPTLKLCVDYHELKTEAERKPYIAELDLRLQLSVKDHENLDKNQIVTGMTMCGMYMTIGKPIAEQSRQLRPMVYKSVHVYPTKYYVTQSGLVVDAHDRKEGEMPPALVVETPDVAPPPVAPK